MNLRQLWQTALTLSSLTFQAASADWYVSLSTGNNRNSGTRQAPLKNIWKAIEMAAGGDTIHVAEGNYPGKMSCGWIDLKKPVSLIGGYNADFSTRDPLAHHTMLRPKNEQNATKPAFGTLTVKTRKSGANASVLIDGFIFDHTAANSYHPAEGKPEGFSDGMLTIPPAKGKTRYPSIDKALLNAETDGSLTIQNCLFLNGSNYAILVAHFSGTVKILNNVFIGNRMMGQPYGWGGYLFNRDCSLAMRDLFVPFGVWLPRNSSAQAKAWQFISFVKASPSGKESIIKDEGVPFATLLWLRGHITLYIGEYKGEPVMFHNVWGVRTNDGNGEGRHIIGRAVVTSLQPGAELPNVRRENLILSRLQGMSVLRYE